MVCHQEKGTTTHFTCTFHGWVYNTKGNLVGLSGPDHSLRKFKERRGLASVRRLDAYRGLIFASLGADGESLDEHLGKAKFFIDLVMDQSTEGIEVIEGMHRSRQKRNWKLQIENGIDGDYGDRTRANSSRAPEERIKSSEEGQTVDFTGPQGFAKDLGNGHVLLQFPVSPQHRVINQRRAELEQRLGAERTQRICETERNLFIFPNLFLIDQTATSLRIINPIAPDYTEQTVIPFAPKGEPIEMIHQRLRYYTTSLSPAAFGEQDDFDALAPHLCGYAAEGVDWQDSSEGVHPERADKGGEGEYVGAVASATAQWGQYRQWKKLMAQDG
jgi:benzoate/toluate 1,2-dioxygenase alpha subunit